MGFELAAENLTCDYGSGPVLEPLSFTLPAGARLAVIGESGCGKSTLLCLLAGLEKPSQGTVTARQIGVSGPGQVPRSAFFVHDALSESREMGFMFSYAPSLPNFKLQRRKPHALPSSAKRSAVGNGGATKEQVARIMAVELGIEIEEIPLDSTDAIALAVCHAQLALRPALAAPAESARPAGDRKTDQKQLREYHDPQKDEKHHAFQHVRGQ